MQFVAEGGDAQAAFKTQHYTLINEPNINVHYTNNILYVHYTNIRRHSPTKLQFAQQSLHIPNEAQKNPDDS